MALPLLLVGAFHVKFIFEPEYVAVGVEGLPGFVFGIIGVY